MTASSTVMVDRTGYLVVGLESARPRGCGSRRRNPKLLACENSLGRVRQKLAGSAYTTLGSYLREENL